MLEETGDLEDSVWDRNVALRRIDFVKRATSSREAENAYRQVVNARMCTARSRQSEEQPQDSKSCSRKRPKATTKKSQVHHITILRTSRTCIFA